MNRALPILLSAFTLIWMACGSDSLPDSSGDVQRATRDTASRPYRAVYQVGDDAGVEGVLNGTITAEQDGRHTRVQTDLTLDGKVIAVVWTADETTTRACLLEGADGQTGQCAEESSHGWFDFVESRTLADDARVTRIKKSLQLGSDLECFHIKVRTQGSDYVWEECYALSGPLVFVNGFGAQGIVTFLQLELANAGLHVTLPVENVSSLEAISVEYPAYLP